MDVGVIQQNQGRRVLLRLGFNESIFSWNKEPNSAAWCCLIAVCCQSNRGAGAARAMLQGREGAAAWHPTCHLPVEGRGHG